MKMLKEKLSGLIGCLSRLVSVRRARWKYRSIDPNECYCGNLLSRGKMDCNSICPHSHCQSLRDYLVQQEIDTNTEIAHSEQNN